MKLAKKFKFKYGTSDYKKIINDTKISNVFITTKHDLHGKLIIESLKAKKYFVEKPLSLKLQEIDEIVDVYDGFSSFLVGYNRRFSPT